MSSIQDLHALIQSLDKSEKRFFKLQSSFQKGEKKYLDIFNLLEKNDLDSTSIKNLIKKKYPKAGLEVSIQHLFKNLLKSLRNYEAEKTIENRLINSIQDIKILFDKGIYKRCFAEIEKAKKSALQYEKFSYCIILARMELQYLTNIEFSEVTETDLISRHTQFSNILDYEFSIHRHSSLYENLLYRYFETGVIRAQDEIEKLNDLLLEEFQIMSNKHYNNFEANAMHLHFQSAYFMMTGNESESLKVFYELDKLFLSNRHLWIDNPLYYIYLVNGILQQLLIAGKFEDMESFISSLNSIKTSSESTLRYIRYYDSYYKSLIQINKGNFDKALKTITTYLTESKSWKISLSGSADMNFNIAVTYFGLEDFKIALKYVNEILNIQRKYLHRQTYVLSRLLNLVIHFELSNYEFLVYELRNLERQLRLEKKFYRVEKVTIVFFKNWIRQPLNKELFQIYQNQLREISEDQFEKRIFRSFDFLAWISSKTNKNSPKNI